MNPVRYLAREEVHPSYGGNNREVVSIDLGHLIKIVPGFGSNFPSNDIYSRLRKLRDRKVDEYIGTMDPLETLILTGIVKAMQPDTIFEIGTQLGMLTSILAAASPDNTKVHTLDIKPSEINTIKYQLDSYNMKFVVPRDEDIGRIYRDAGLGHKVTQHLGDSAVFDFSHFYGMMDIVVVDGNHHPEAVKHDLGEALKMAKQGGLVVVDDYWRHHHLQGPTIAVLDFSMQGHTFYSLYDEKPQNPELAVKSHLAIHPNVPGAKLKNSQKLDLM